MARLLLIAILGSLLASTQANSGIQKVIEILQKELNKSTELKAKEEKQYIAFSQWCSDEKRNRARDIEDDHDAIENANASIEQQTGEIQKASADLEAAVFSIGKNEREAKKAHDQCQKTKVDQAGNQKELNEALNQLTHAARILKPLIGSSLLQAKSSPYHSRKEVMNMLRGISTILDAVKIDMEDKSALKSLLSTSEEDEDDDEKEDPFAVGGSTNPTAAPYESKAGNILEVIDNLKGKTERALSELLQEMMKTDGECSLLKNQLQNEADNLEKEQANLQGDISEGQETKGKAEGDLATGQKELADDEAYVQNVTEMCDQKAKDYAQRQEAQGAESEAFKQAIDALTQGSFTEATQRTDSFLQVQLSKSAAPRWRSRAAEMLEQAARKIGSLGLSQLAVRMRGGEDPFGKVKTMIEDMITRLMTAANEAADKKAWCDAETKKTANRKERLNGRVDNLNTRIDQSSADIAELNEQINTLTGDLAEMASSFSKQSTIRQEEAATNQQTIADCIEAQSGIGQAISFLKKIAPPASLVQQEPPETFSGSYVSSGASGVIPLLQQVLEDYGKLQFETGQEEESASGAFQKYSGAYKVDSAAKESTMKAKKQQVATTQSALQDLNADEKMASKELDTVQKYEAKILDDCTPKAMSYEEKSAKREKEIESLQEALRILEEETAVQSTNFLQQTRRH